MHWRHSPSVHLHTSEQFEQCTDDQYEHETDQETDNSADEHIADLLLVDDRVDDDHDDRCDDSSVDSEYERHQQTDDESYQCCRITQIKTALFLCYCIPSFEVLNRNVI